MDKKKTNKRIRNVVILSVLFVAAVMVFVFWQHIFGAESVFNKAITNNDFINTCFQKIPAVIATFQIVVITIIIFQIIKLIMTQTFKGSNKQITIVKLFISFLRWAVIIVAILLILSAWGVNTTALIASAGIMALIIGLGAQSLIADIIAGVFIVFEGDFQVGDIVVIDGWRGSVLEIGIRTTKVTDAGGNVKIINNSKISSIVNQTAELSVARCVMSIDYGESLERVELVIRDNLESIKKRIPEIVEGPFYKGVTELGGSSVDLLFMAKCSEQDIYQVQRDLNREFYILFNKNNINIPFPQVTISEREDTDDNKITKTQEKQARAFADDQAEQSRGIEDKTE